MVKEKRRICILPNYGHTHHQPFTILPIAFPFKYIAVLCIITQHCIFIWQKRNETLKCTETLIQETYPIIEGNEVMRSKKTVLQIIDTTLLKCYLKVRLVFHCNCFILICFIPRSCGEKPHIKIKFTISFYMGNSACTWHKTYGRCNI